MRASSQDDSKELIAMAQYRESRQKQPAFVPKLRCTDDAVLYGFGTQLILHVLRAFMAASACDSKEGRISEVVILLFRDRWVAVTLMNGGRFLLIIVELNSRKTEYPFANTITRTIFAVISFFHCSLVFDIGLQ